MKVNWYQCGSFHDRKVDLDMAVENFRSWDAHDEITFWNAVFFFLKDGFFFKNGLVIYFLAGSDSGNSRTGYLVKCVD